MNTVIFSLTIRVAALLIFGAGFISAAAAAEEADPQDTVVSFNHSISNRQVDAALANLTAGGVQFTLRSLHEGINPGSFTTDLVKHWATIIPVVLSATSSYDRQIEILDSQVNGDIATIWGLTRTESIRLNSTQKTSSSFTELYLLIHTPGGWKIAAIADNRQATKLASAQD